MEIYKGLLLLSLYLLHHSCHGADESIIMKKIERQTLGNIPVLGQLYSAQSDQLLHGFSFWFQEDIEENKIKTWHPWQETHINRDQSQDVDFSLLKVDAQLEASFKAGLIKIAGSAAYLQREPITDKSSSVTFSYQSRSRTESISPSLTQNRPIDVCNKDNPVNKLDKNSAPTHVVSAITYGGDVHFVYTEENQDKEDLMDIYGALSITIRLGLININGRASVNYTTNENDLKNKLKIEMYSDFIIDKQPTSFDDTIKIYETVAQNFGSKESMYEMSVPMSMQLIPIIAFCPEGGQAAEISASFLKVATNIRLKLKGALKEIEALLSSTAAKRNVKVREILLDFQMDVSNYTLNYESQLKKTIVDARNPMSDVDESAIDDLVKAYKNSKFDYDKYLYPYITERTRQVHAINMFYELTFNQNEPQIADYRKAEIPRAILIRPVLFLLTLNILPNVSTERYSAYVTNIGDNSRNSAWYNDKTKVGQIGQLWRDFFGFFSFNEYKAGFEFFVETLEENIDTDVMGINVYENGMKIEMDKEDFANLVQSAPEIIVSKTDTNSIKVEVAAPIDNTGDKPFEINNLEVQIIQSTIDSSNLYPSPLKRIEKSLEDVCSNGKCEIDIADIQPFYSYNVSVAYSSKFGLGKPSKIMAFNGVFDEMMKTTGCIIENNLKLDEMTGRTVSTVCECAEGSSDHWSYDIGSKKCYDQIGGKNAKSPTIGWATGTTSCNGGNACLGLGNGPPPAVTVPSAAVTTKTIMAATTTNGIGGCVWKDMPGNDLSQAAGMATLKECDDKCLADPQCSHFTWSSHLFTDNPHNCWLKSASAPFADLAGLVSGSQGCSYGNDPPPAATTTTPDPVGCYNTGTKGSDYRGKISVTVNGYTCQSWDSTSPHDHPHSGKPGLEGNDCRNPDGTNKPWCYTTDKDKRWEVCDVPPC